MAHVDREITGGGTKRDQALEHYRLAGEALVELKAICTRGEFSSHIEKCAFTHNFANRLMRLAREWPCTWDRWQEICGNGSINRLRA